MMARHGRESQATCFEIHAVAWHGSPAHGWRWRRGRRWPCPVCKASDPVVGHKPGDFGRSEGAGGGRMVVLHGWGVNITERKKALESGGDGAGGSGEQGGHNWMIEVMDATRGWWESDEGIAGLKKSRRVSTVARCLAAGASKIAVECGDGIGEVIEVDEDSDRGVSVDRSEGGRHREELRLPECSWKGRLTASLWMAGITGEDEGGWRIDGGDDRGGEDEGRWGLSRGLGEEKNPGT